MSRFSPAFHTLTKAHPHVAHQLNPRSMTPIVAITLTNFRPFLELSIKGRSVIVLVHIRFPVARDLHFIARILKIREQIGLATNEAN